ncbi:chondroitin sulfate proteoglycan 5-like isoform X2 [Betta splendens]|uniref:Chondroitin sulfate proteoglycan 5-like isoform X2 n=1 Tax=Betta splendens TaxID=158456 RepID=A0A9W2Y518_BETSP|nr:chondroitin sulfate proteoglycan 5-like isoform X2 [Betta splendens]
MARGGTRLWTWQVLLTLSVVVIPLSAHGRHSLSRRHHHHHNQSSFAVHAQLSDDSAERDHLIGAGLGAKHRPPHKHAKLDFAEEDAPVGEELTAGGAGPDQPENPLTHDVVTVAFHSQAPDAVPADGAREWAKVPKAQKQKGGSTHPWSNSDFYEYMSPDDDHSADTTPEPEPTPSPPPNMEDENPFLDGSPSIRDKVKPSVDNTRSLPAPPMPGPGTGDGLGLSGAMGADGCRLGFVRTGPGVCSSQCDTEPDFCLNGGVCTVVAGMGAFCRCNVQDYIWNKGTRCDWAVTEFQVLCAVVGVASFVLLLLFMIVVFFAKRLHRLKSENKRLRKRSKYRPQSSEPQTDGLSVSTTADGSQPNVRKLCDTPPPATQAHTHNLAYYDNIICQRPPSTSSTWQYKPRDLYNHFQDEPQKQEEPAKSPQPKEEGSMNILNSHSPKHENNRPSSVGHERGHSPDGAEEKAEDGVSIGLEVLLPKEARLHPETRPLGYDVFLYKVASDGDAPSTHSAGICSASHPVPKSPKSPKIPKSPKSPRHGAEPPPSTHQPLMGRHSSPGRHTSPGRQPAPGGCSPGLRAPSHHSAAQYKCMFTSTPPQLRRPRGRSQGPGPESSAYGREYHIRPSPSSPHLTQPPPSPSKVQYNPVSTRSLPPLS